MAVDFVTETSNELNDINSKFNVVSTENQNKNLSYETSTLPKSLTHPFYKLKLTGKKLEIFVECVVDILLVNIKLILAGLSKT